MPDDDHLIHRHGPGSHQLLQHAGKLLEFELAQLVRQLADFVDRDGPERPEVDERVRVVLQFGEQGANRYGPNPLRPLAAA